MLRLICVEKSFSLRIVLLNTSCHLHLGMYLSIVRLHVSISAYLSSFLGVGRCSAIFRPGEGAEVNGFEVGELKI